MHAAPFKNHFFYLQATAVLYQGKAFLILGPPGCGKSRLAYGLIQKGGKLFNDDLVYLEQGEKKIILHPLPRYAGCLYLRGYGFLAVPFQTHDTQIHGLILLGGAPIPRPFSKRNLHNLFILRR